MKTFVLISVIASTFLFVSGLSTAYAEEFQAVFFRQPSMDRLTTWRSPVKVCLGVIGLEVEPAKNGVNKGKGHHHIIVDVHLPQPVENPANVDPVRNPHGMDFIKPLRKDKNHVHFGGGSACAKIKLSSGKHVLRALFSKGNHVPYYPPITATRVITVR